MAVYEFDMAGLGVSCSLLHRGRDDSGETSCYGGLHMITNVRIGRQAVRGGSGGIGKGRGSVGERELLKTIRKINSPVQDPDQMEGRLAAGGIWLRVMRWD